MKKFIVTFSIMLLWIAGLTSIAYNTWSYYSGDVYSWWVNTWSNYTWWTNTWSANTWSNYTWWINTWSANTWSNYTWWTNTWSANTWSNYTWWTNTWWVNTWSNYTWWINTWSNNTGSNNKFNYSTEIQEAYERAYNNWIINEGNIDKANLNNTLTNLELADIMNKYAEKILKQTPDPDRTCNFNDISWLATSKQNIIKKSCQLWLIPIENGKKTFNPNQAANRATFWTMLSRALRWARYEGGNPYYIDHLNALKTAWIMNQINNPESKNEIKWYVLSMIMNSIGKNNSWKANTWTSYTWNNYTWSNYTGSNYTWSNTAAYTIRYYYQLNWKYSDDLSKKKTRYWTVGETAKVTNSDKTPQLSWYIFDSWATNVTSGKIKADGSLTLKLHFKEKSNWVNTWTNYTWTNYTWNIYTGSKDAELTNKLTKTIEFNSNEVSRKVVFDWKYTALKDTSFNSIHIQKLFKDKCRYPENDVEKRDTMKFYLMVDGDEIKTQAAINIDECDNWIGIWFNEIKVKKGSSISIKIEGENISQTSEILDKKYKVTLKHSEDFDTVVWWEASANTAPIRFKDDGSEFTIQTPSEKNTVNLKSRNAKLAEFIIKPAKWNTAQLNELALEIDQSRIKHDDIRVMIDSINQEFTLSNDWNIHIICQPNIDVPSEWVPVKIILKSEPEYHDLIIWTNVKSINGKNINKTFSKRFISALVYISKQENKWDYTEYTLWVETYDFDYYISSVCMLTWSTGAWNCLLGENTDNWPFEDWYTFTVKNSDSNQLINYIIYVIKNSERNGWADSITIKRNDYPDFFKMRSWEQRKVYSSSSNSSNESHKDSKSWNNTQNSYSTETSEAYQFAYENWITTKPSVEKAKMDEKLTRIQMAKMLSYYAINVLWMEPDTSKWTVRFNDVSDKMNKQYDNAVTLAYQLWIMWQNIKSNNFRPNDEVTRAEFATALWRMLYWTEDVKWNMKYYEPYMARLYNEWIINKADPKMKERRWYVMTMLMRTAE